MTSGEEQMMTRVQAADLLQVHVSTVKRLERDKRLKRYGEGRIARYRRGDVLRCLGARNDNAEAGDVPTAPPVDTLSVKAAAEALSVSADTVYAWIKRGHVASVRLGGPRSPHRIPRSEVERLSAESGRATEVQQ